MAVPLHIIPLLLLIAVAACGQKPQPLIPPSPATSSASNESLAGTTRSILRVTKFSPDRIAAGRTFNLQADGNSGIWFELDRPVPGAGFSAWFDDKPLTSVVSSGRVVTATIPAQYLATPGHFEIELEVGGTRLPAGEFVVYTP